MNKISIIGSGAMGTAIAKVLHDSKIGEILIYGIDDNELSDLQNGKNKKYFSEDTKLPHFKTTNKIEEAIKFGNYIVIATPSVVVDKVIVKINNLLSKNTLFLNISKGFYPGTTKSLHTGIVQALKDNHFFRGVVSIVGPSHAEEIVKEFPTLVSVVNENEKIAKEVQSLIKCPYFRTYVQTDVIGAEVGGTYKNVLAIAAGILAGRGYGVNTNAALLTRGFSEMITLNEALGGKMKTICGLTGIGDLIVTATSPLSRNYSFGFDFAKNKNTELGTKTTVEGLAALKVIHKLAKEKSLELPIIENLNNLINKRYSIDETLKNMFSRISKVE